MYYPCCRAQVVPPHDPCNNILGSIDAPAAHRSTVPESRRSKPYSDEWRFWSHLNSALKGLPRWCDRFLFKVSR